MIQAILDKINQQIAEQLYLGASLAIFDKGMWQEHYIGQVTETEPARPELVYDIASVSKVVGVGTILYRLYGKGLLDLDAPFQTVYPAFHDPTVTVRQLVTHTSGIDPYIANRDELNREQLKASIQKISVTADKGFRYTDINLILLGFYLEELFGKSLSTILREEIFDPWGLHKTRFGAGADAVPTVKGQPAGRVHDPKAQVLGEHCGSAGLFSTLTDLKIFCQHYMSDADFADIATNFSSDKPRSIVWNLEGDWIDHTGYTGPFMMVNRKSQQAVIFLTNRTYLYDDRPLWIEKRAELMNTIKEVLR